jgi:hypothetical protein
MRAKTIAVDRRPTMSTSTANRKTAPPTTIRPETDSEDEQAKYLIDQLSVISEGSMPTETRRSLLFIFPIRRLRHTYLTSYHLQMGGLRQKNPVHHKRFR